VVKDSSILVTQFILPDRFRKSMEPEDAQRFKSDFAIVESRMPKCIVIQSAKNLEGIR